VTERVRRRPWGARARITIVVTIAFTVAAATLSIGLVSVLRSQLIGNVDLANDRRAHDIASMLDEASADDPVANQLPTSRGDADLAQVIGSDGKVLAASADIAGAPALPHDLDAPITVASLQLNDQNLPYRLTAISQAGPDGTPRTIVVGRSLEHLEATVDSIVLALLVGVPSLALLVALLTWIAVARSLRPVEAIRDEFSRISSSDLHRRVPDPGTNDEVGALADTLNETLETLERDVVRQQRFVADAAHELRSPLAALSAQLELVRTQATLGDDAATAATLLHQARRLEQLIDDLLLLARHDAGPHGSGRRRLVDLDELVLEEAMRARLTSAVSIDTADVSSAQVRGDSDSLQRVVRNLLDNAVRHARTAVVLSLHERDAAAVLLVDDDGPGIPPGERQRIFERFTRLADARDRRSGGTGLGLAICTEIVADHGGAIEATDNPNGGARLVVTLPVAALPAPHGPPSLDPATGADARGPRGAMATAAVRP
jgi:signal transduction histidine kinase